jgi:putative transposase
MSRFVHLNPVKARLVATPEDRAFSSYRDYIGLRAGSLPELSSVLSRFSEPSEYRDFVNAYLDTDRKRISDLLFE